MFLWQSYHSCSTMAVTKCDVQKNIYGLTNGWGCKEWMNQTVLLHNYLFDIDDTKLDSLLLINAGI